MGAAARVSLHLSIDASIMVGFFSYAMLCAYVAFVPPETATRLLLGVRDRLMRDGSERSSAEARPAT